MTTLAIGDKAPDFNLPKNGGGTTALSDYAGQKLVLYFYPKDSTEACTLEALDFTRLLPEFEAAGATVVGMSPDSPKKHDNFSKKYGLGVTLVADESTEVLSSYGVWAEKQMYGRTYMGVVRTTILIGPDGRIAAIWPKVSVKGHAEEVLAATRALK
jgi:thioredoxin-dependent peroxiredoxin